MFDNLSERLERSFKILKGEGKITEINVAETLKDVRKALLDADVNYKVCIFDQHRFHAQTEYDLRHWGTGKSNTPHFGIIFSNEPFTNGNGR